MADGGDQPDSLLGRFARRAGRRIGAAERAFRSGRETGTLPADEEGRVRIVCRRYRERRAVALDDAARPACFDPDSPDCRGCVEDIRAGRIETWEPEPGPDLGPDPESRSESK